PGMNERKWLGPLHPLVSRWEFRRGFVDKVAVGPRRFVRQADDLFRLAPVQHVAISNESIDRTLARELVRLTALDRLTGLELKGYYSGGLILEALMMVRPSLGRLTDLTLTAMREEGSPQGWYYFLLDRRLVGRLTALRLRQSLVAARELRRLLGNPRLNRLTTLDLSENPLDHEDVSLLAGWPPAVRLATLILQNVAMTPEGVRNLAGS